jgi:hypothetical protein
MAAYAEGRLRLDVKPAAKKLRVRGRGSPPSIEPLSARAPPPLCGKGRECSSLAFGRGRRARLPPLLPVAATPRAGPAAGGRPMTKLGGRDVRGHELAPASALAHRPAVVSVKEGRKLRDPFAAARLPLVVSARDGLRPPLTAKHSIHSSERRATAHGAHSPTEGIFRPGQPSCRARTRRQPGAAASQGRGGLGAGGCSCKLRRRSCGPG